jgi:acyl-CoA synthetase (NDP forming)
MSENGHHFLENFVNPKSIAFYGANNDILKTMGTAQLLNLLDSGYKGKVFPIHLNLESVLGLPTHKTISEIQEQVDLAIVILPTKVIPQIFRELGQKDVKNVILVTAGFREMNNAMGEKELNEIAKEYGIKFFGPNCIGMLNTHCQHSPESNELKSVFNCTWVGYVSKPGNVSVISQSGTYACHIFHMLEERDLHLSKSFSVGNEANIDICDCLEYLAEDPTTEVILLYIEEIKRGRKFLELVKKINPKKPILALYVGGSKGGARAVASHTGSMAGNNAVFDAAFHQAGVIRVQSLEELLDTGMLFSKLLPRNCIPKGRRIAIVTNAGGPGATMADYASRIGLDIPDFSLDLKEKIQKYLPATARASNPLDYTFSINPAIYFDTMPKLLAKSGEIDLMVAYGAFGPRFIQRGLALKQELIKDPNIQQQMHQFLELLDASLDASRKTLKKYQIPFIYVNPLGLEDPVFQMLNEAGFPTLKMDHRAIKAIYNLIKYGEFMQKTFLVNHT